MAFLMMSTFASLIGLVVAGLGALTAWGWRAFARRRGEGDAAAAALSADERRELLALRQAHALLQDGAQLLQARVAATEHELVSFAYSVSHDLRAPLRGIDGFSQALTEDYGDRLDATAHDYLRRVRANAVHMSALIDDLVSLSRVVRAPFRAEPVDVSALARGIARSLTATEPTRPVRWDIPSNMTAVADREMLAEALRQLLANAWKFTSARDVAQISLHTLAPDPEHPAGTVYQVSDNGVGFDMQYAGKLFGAFQRMHAPEEFPAGRGIGLAMVRRIVHRHGGRVWAEAIPEQGARFSFTLEAASSSRGGDDVSAVGGLSPLTLEAGVTDAPVPRTTRV